jgi:hypothetical protein
VLAEAGPAGALHAPVRLREAVDRDGRPLRFYLNFSSDAQSFPNPGGAGTAFLAGRPVVRLRQLPVSLPELATARAGVLVLVTHNTREFGRVAGRRIEDWES